MLHAAAHVDLAAGRLPNGGHGGEEILAQQAHQLLHDGGEAHAPATGPPQVSVGGAGRGGQLVITLPPPPHTHTPWTLCPRYRWK